MHRFPLASVAVWLALGLLGCDDGAGSAEPAMGDGGIGGRGASASPVDGGDPRCPSAEALSLEMLADPALTVEVLVALGLPEWAALNILEHLAGADGQLGTADDAELGGLDELGHPYFGGASTPAVIREAVSVDCAIPTPPLLPVEVPRADEVGTPTTTPEPGVDTTPDLDGPGRPRFWRRPSPRGPRWRCSHGGTTAI